MSTPHPTYDPDADRGISHVTGEQAPPGHWWGERTAQSITQTAPDWWQSDAYEIRKVFGIERFDADTLRSILNHPHGRMVYPDLIVHEKDPTVTTSSKGNDCLVVGRRDSGKTTLAKHLGLRGMEDHHDLVGEHNAHKVIWRGRSDGSGWLPLKPWTTLWLPAHADVEAVWMTEGDEADADPRSRVDDLEDVVRDVFRYRDVYDLLDQLGERPGGTIHVVMPDPTFAGCEEAFQQSDRANAVPFVPEFDATGDRTPTPLIHWWFAFLLARREYGPFEWWAFLFDEMGDWVPARAEQDEHRLRDKVNALKATWKALRKRYMSIYGFVQYETDVFEEVRRRFQTRIDMPDGTSNPRNTYRREVPLGFDDVGMHTDFMGTAPVGTGLCYVDGTKASFSKFSWSDFPPWPEDSHRWLRIRVRAPSRRPEALRETEDEDDGPELEYDDQVLKTFQNKWVHQLRVLAPGAGIIDLEDLTIDEDLASPIDGLTFVDGLRERRDHFEVRMVRDDVDDQDESAVDEEIVVARLPKDLRRVDPSASTVGVAHD